MKPWNAVASFETIQVGRCKYSKGPSTFSGFSWWFYSWVVSEFSGLSKPPTVALPGLVGFGPRGEWLSAPGIESKDGRALGGDFFLLDLFHEVFEICLGIPNQWEVPKICCFQEHVLKTNVTKHQQTQKSQHGISSCLQNDSTKELPQAISVKCHLGQTTQLKPFDK